MKTRQKDSGEITPPIQIRLVRPEPMTGMPHNVFQPNTPGYDEPSPISKGEETDSDDD